MTSESVARSRLCHTAIVAAEMGAGNVVFHRWFAEPAAMMTACTGLS